MGKAVKRELRAGMIMTLAALVLIVSALLYVGAVTSSLRMETQQMLSEVAIQNASAIEHQIRGDFNTVEAIALWFGNQQKPGTHPDLHTLDEQAQNVDFKRLGFILPDGTTYASDGAILHLGDRQFFQQAMNGETVISERLIDQDDQRPIYVYATPVRAGGTVSGVLFATNREDTYRDLLGETPYGGKGECYIICSDGEIMLSANEEELLKVGDNLSVALETQTLMSSPARAQMQMDLLAGTGGVIEYRGTETTKYLSYMPIYINDWFVVSSLPSNVVSGKFTYLSVLTLGACVFVVAIILGLFAYIVHIQKKNKRSLERLAFTDPVTGGRNWNGFVKLARQVIDQHPLVRHAMVNFDIDKFKVFNDLFGHEQGNLVLRRIWEILRGSLAPDEIFARVSADNFDILMQYSQDTEIESRLGRIAELIERETRGSGANYMIKLSFGVYCIDEVQLPIDVMSDRAGIARREIKGNHEQLISFYDRVSRERIVAEKKIENDMVDALEKGEFEVYLQPQYSLDTRKIVGAEALVRWNRPDLGMVPPGEFIPLFEKNGFVVNVDVFVFRKVCERIAYWTKLGMEPVPVAVNISRVHLHDPAFVQSLAHTARSFGVPQGLLEIELTESAVLDFEDNEKLIDLMYELKEAGFRLAMDDFGTGYSSLNLLRKLPVDVLKLDREFFGGCRDARRGEIVIADVVSMAKHLNISVVAEGVETQEQVDFLLTTGCDIVQGYYFEKPMSISSFERLRMSEMQNQ